MLPESDRSFNLTTVGTIAGLHHRSFRRGDDPPWQQRADTIIVAGKVSEVCALIDQWLAHPKGWSRPFETKTRDNARRLCYTQAHPPVRRLNQDSNELIGILGIHRPAAIGIDS